MNTNNKKTMNHEVVQDEAQQKRHPVLAVRNLLPSIIKEENGTNWSTHLKDFWQHLSSRLQSWGRSLIASKETLAATTAVVIIATAVIALYIYGAALAA
ncbi:MAG: hypothetical protein WD552_00620 [Candidatus Paceibacterota bacterium]